MGNRVSELVGAALIVLAVAAIVWAFFSFAPGLNYVSWAKWELFGDDAGQSEPITDGVDPARLAPYPK